MSKTTPPADGQGRPTRLLVVDDHEESLSALTILLNRAGYRVLAAGTLADAMLAAERASFASDPVDVLVSDLELGDGSGLDVARKLQARFGTRAIALTGHTDRDDRREADAAGFEHFLPKPAIAADLLAALAKLRPN